MSTGLGTSFLASSSQSLKASGSAEGGGGRGICGGGEGAGDVI